jgi:hypothetical protein
MKADIENNEWKEEAPYLAGLKKENPFSVPENYFDALSETIVNSVYVSELKADIPMPGFTVPDQYFSSLHDRILTETGLLNSLPSSEGFSVPDQYFQKLQSKILDRVAVEKQTPTAVEEEIAVIKAAPAGKSKIVRLWHSGLLKYASAACFVLATTFGLYLNQQHQITINASANDIANEQMLYDISEQDVIDHVQGIPADAKIDSKADADLENYILNNFSQNDLSSAIN